MPTRQKKMKRQVERRTHTKSRKGCLQCKQRHVKCNEQRPQCARCERLEIDCQWPGQRPSEAVKDEAPVHGGGTENNIRAIVATDCLDVRDMVLLQFWFLQYLWQSSVVDLGFRHHFLLRAVLATAAIHKASIHQDEAPELLLYSSQHMDIAMAAFREHLMRPDPATCIPVFALACLLVMHRLGFAQVQAPVDPIEELCVISRLSRGIKPTVSDYWSRILSSEMGPLITSATQKFDTARSFPDVLQLKALVADQQHLSSSLQADFISAIEDLHETFSNTGQAAQPAIGSIFSWIANLSNQFLDSLASKEPMGLLIIAHFAGLIRSGGRIWYLRNWATWLLDAAESHLTDEYCGWLEWPRHEIPARVVGKEIDVSF